jgi:hypothetical protein
MRQVASTWILLGAACGAPFTSSAPPGATADADIYTLYIDASHAGDASHHAGDASAESAAAADVDAGNASDASQAPDAAADGAIPCVVANCPDQGCAMTQGSSACCNGKNACSCTVYGDCI